MTKHSMHAHIHTHTHIEMAKKKKKKKRGCCEDEMEWVLRAPGASPPFSAPARLKVGFGTRAGNIASSLLFETPQWWPPSQEPHESA